MKNYMITVNGTSYEVSVEEVSGQSVSAAPVAPIAPAAPKAAPVAPVVPAAAPKASGAQGSVTVSSPMPGKILAIKAEAGTVVTKGQAILILEAMKMENEIVAPSDGTLVSVNVSAGDSVEAGTLLATLN